jgi:hypothetical protein
MVLRRSRPCDATLERVVAAAEHTRVKTPDREPHEMKSDRGSFMKNPNEVSSTKPADRRRSLAATRKDAKYRSRQKQ